MSFSEWKALENFAFLVRRARNRKRNFLSKSAATHRLSDRDQMIATGGGFMRHRGDIATGC